MDSGLFLAFTDTFCKDLWHIRVRTERMKVVMTSGSRAL